MPDIAKVRMRSALIGASLVAVFAAIAAGVAASSRVTGWDRRVAEWLVSLRTPPLTRFFWLMTVLGDEGVMLVLVLVCGVAFAVWGRPRAGIAFVGSLAVGRLVVETVKLVAQRVRPPGAIALIETPASYSFPSGHAFNGVVFFVLGALLLALALRGCVSKPLVLGLGAVLGLSMGASRAFLGVHWPSDVVASWALAAAWVLLSWEAALKLGVERERSPMARSARLRAVVTSAVLLAVAVAAIVYATTLDPLIV